MKPDRVPVAVGHTWWPKQLPICGMDVLETRLNVAHVAQIFPAIPMEKDLSAALKQTKNGNKLRFSLSVLTCSDVSDVVWSAYMIHIYIYVYMFICLYVENYLGRKKR